MGWVSEAFTCNNCQHYFEDLVQREDKDLSQMCPECNVNDSRRAIVAPQFMRPSLHIGPNEVAGNTTYKKLKEAVHLEVEMANLEHDKKGDIKKAIKELRSTNKQGEGNNRKGKK